MSNYKITSDTTCDLPDSYLTEHDISILPLYYNLNDVIYGDEINMTPHELFDKMREGNMPSTMACNPETTEKIFRNILEEGYDILHIAFSSTLSSSYNTAAIVGKELSEEFPDRKIIVIDSKSASLGEGLIVYNAAKNKAEGMSIDDNAKWVEQNMLNVCHLFTVNDLFHLHRGGRVSKATAIIGTMINVKPVLHVDNNGALVPLNNVRGRKKAINALADNMGKVIDGFNNDVIMISHGDCYDEAFALGEQLKERYGVKEVIINYVCPTIGAHTGPGVIALFYMGNQR